MDEKSWMLPYLDDDLSSDKKSKKKKSHKEKKHKKKKKKSRHESSSNSEDEWVEKPKPKETSSRDSWMSMESSFGGMGKVSRQESSRESAKSAERRREEAERLDKMSRLELNPTLRKEYQQKSKGSENIAMMKRAVERVYDQAKFEKKSVKDIATARWGSYEKFLQMEAKISEYEKAGDSGLIESSRKSSESSRPSSGWKTDARREKDKQRYESKREKSPEKHEEIQVESKKVEDVQNEAATPMSEEEMNKLSAKIIKAEMMGQHEKAQKFKEKLEAAKAANEERLKNGPPNDDPVTVVLTRTDSKGLTRPIDADVNRSEVRKLKGKAQTHSEGQRVRYFADDDRYDLKQMFHREKTSTAEDQNLMMSRLAGKSVEKTNDDDYSIDDMFVSRAAKKRSEEQDRVRERDAAIAEHQMMSKALDSCQYCFESSEFKKHLLVAVGKTCYVTLPWHYSLTQGHCFIVPMSHVKCATLLDEDVYAEMQSYRASLCSMFTQNDLDCVFFECAKGLKRHPHMIIECVPLPRDIGDMAPMYFQKAIDECESEWSHNKKLVKLTSEKNIRRSVPKGLPYFHVDFGMQNGIAHVIEDELEFPRNFAQGKIISKNSIPI